MARCSARSLTPRSVASAPTERQASASTPCSTAAPMSGSAWRPWARPATKRSTTVSRAAGVRAAVAVRAAAADQPGIDDVGQEHAALGDGGDVDVEERRHDARAEPQPTADVPAGRSNDHHRRSGPHSHHAEPSTTTRSLHPSGTRRWRPLGRAVQEHTTNSAGASSVRWGTYQAIPSWWCAAGSVPSSPVPTAPTHVLLDLDGTLSASAPGITRSLRLALLAEGLDAAERGGAAGGGRAALRARPPAARRARGPRWAVIERYRDRYDHVGVYETTAYDGVEAMLDDLVAAGLVLSLATAKPEATAVRVIDHFGWTTASR